MEPEARGFGVAPTGDPSSMLSLLRRSSPMRRLWVAQVVSVAGDWLATVALSTAVYLDGGSAMRVALVLVAGTLPALVASPWIGRLADRGDERDLMIAADAGRALAGIVLAIWLDCFAVLLAMRVCLALFGGLFNPARQRLIPRLVRPAELISANALSSLTFGLMAVVGAALGGLLTASVGAETALAIDAASFAVSAWILRRLPCRGPSWTGGRAGTSWLARLGLSRGSGGGVRGPGRRSWVGGRPASEGARGPASEGARAPLRRRYCSDFVQGTDRERPRSPVRGRPRPQGRRVTPDAPACQDQPPSSAPPELSTVPSKLASLAARRPPSPRHRPTARPLRPPSGLHAIRHTPVVRRVVLAGISWGFVGGAWQVLVTLYGVDVYGAGAGGVGTLHAVQGVGMVLGSLLVGRLTGGGSRRIQWVFAVAYAAQALLFALFACTTDLLTGSLVLLAMRVCGGVVVPLDATLLQRHAPSAALGQVLALHGAVYGSVTQLSMALCGALVERLGPRAVGLGFAAVGFSTGVALVVSVAWRVDGRGGALPTRSAA